MFQLKASDVLTAPIHLRYYRFNEKTGWREQYTYATVYGIMPPKLYRQDGTLRSSIVVKGKRYYKE